MESARLKNELDDLDETKRGVAERTIIFPRRRPPRPNRARLNHEHTPCRSSPASAGNLGRRLLMQLHDTDVIGVDVRPPEDISLARFEQMDFGTEESCER